MFSSTQTCCFCHKLDIVLSTDCLRAIQKQWQFRLHPYMYPYHVVRGSSSRFCNVDALNTGSPVVRLLQMNAFDHLAPPHLAVVASPYVSSCDTFVERLVSSIRLFTYTFSFHTEFLYLLIYQFANILSPRTHIV